MKQFKQLTTASILTGSLVGLALNGIPGAASSVHAQAPRYTTCAVNEYRDTAMTTEICSTSTSIGVAGYTTSSLGDMSPCGDAPRLLVMCRVHRTRGY